MTTEHVTSTRLANQVIAIGILDQQRQYGRELTLHGTRNELQGREERIVLQVLSPFGKPFALPIHLDGRVPGDEMLANVTPGTRLTATGRLEWEQRIDTRYAGSAQEQGRRASELTFRVAELRAAVDEEESGCDVWIEGEVMTPARVLRHPYKTSVLLAQTRLRVSVERQRRNSRVRIVETEQVPVVIPLNHADAPNLLRPRNRVAIEGMLERVVVELRGKDVERAVAALDAEWQRRLENNESRADQRAYVRERERLSQATRSRVVAGYVELLAGEPASIQEAQALRRAFARGEQRRADARNAEEATTTEA